jgi:hypothetical protein
MANLLVATTMSHIFSDVSHCPYYLTVRGPGLPVGGSNNEDRLLGVHAVHLRQQLVEHTVSGTAGVTGTAATLVCDTVQLIKEEHAGGRLPGLVKNLTDIGLGLTCGAQPSV